MRVLFVYRFLTLGGVESVLRVRLEGLEAEGIEAQAWFLSDGGALETFRDLRDQVRVGSLPALVDHIRDLAPQVVSSIDTEEVLDVGRGLRAPPTLVVECHTPYLQNQSYLSRLDRQTVRAVLVPSEYQRRAVLARAPGGIPVSVVPNPVDRSFLDSVDGHTEAAGAPVVAWVGRLDSLKNWDEYLEISGLLLKSGLKVRFRVIGDSREPDIPGRLYKKAKEVGVLPFLSWHRAVRYTDMPELLATVRWSGGLVVSTSRNESFGMAIAEAMASNNAVLAPNQGPFPELISEGVTGSLYEPRDVTSASEKAALILKDDGLRLRLAEAARLSVAERFAPERALRTLAIALRDAVAQGAQSL